MPDTTVAEGRAIRAALRIAFPACRFSVRRGAGTSATWITVTWTDGPTEMAATAIVGQHRDLTGPYSGRTQISRTISPQACEAHEETALEVLISDQPEHPALHHPTQLHRFIVDHLHTMDLTEPLPSTTLRE